MEAWIRDICREMPKAELHLHLDGALRVKTAMELARSRGWRDFEKRLGYREMHDRMIVPHALASQAELLGYFEIPGMLLNTGEALRRVTRELIGEKAADNVRYCEIRWAPQLHTGEGMSVTEVVNDVLDEARKACEKTGITVRFIAVGMRTQPLERNLDMLESIAPYAGDGISAVDLAGLEQAFPDALEQERFFLRARELGFGITVHCGELPHSASRIREQAERLRPARIAHGPGAAEDPALCDFLRERDIMLDLCPTSNIQAGLYPDLEAYPLRELVKTGVPVSISTDDNILSGITLSDEYAGLLNAGQLDLPELWRLNLEALRHAFLEEDERLRLLSEFENWAKGVDELVR